MFRDYNRIQEELKAIKKTLRSSEYRRQLLENKLKEMEESEGRLILIFEIW
jgi:hypothetical protein